MRKLLLLTFLASFLFASSQSASDGCMNVRLVATWAWNQEYEDPFGNDESNWQWWFADWGNYDGAGWSGGNCLAQGGFFQIGWWNHTDAVIFDHTYGTAGPNNSLVPVSYSLRGHYEGDDCGGSCDKCTSNPFDNDDYRYDETVSGGINYRFAAPNANNTFQRFTTWHGSSDYGGEFYARYTSPRPTISANLNQICFGQTTAVTFTCSGAAFGGNYVVEDAFTNAVVYNNSTPTFTLNLSSGRTFNVYSSNGGVRSLCYSTIVVNTYACNTDYNCLSTNVSGGTVSAYSTDGPRAGGLNTETSFFQSNFLANSYIVDINVPGTNGYNNILMEVGHNNTTVSSSVVSLPGTLIDLRADVPFDIWWDNATGGNLAAGSAELQVCACKTADYGTATVNGSAAGITLCEDDASSITLAHNGSVNSFDDDGYGDELRWYSGSCGGTYLGSGLTLSIPSPSTSTTYYASMYANGNPCRGANSYCESVTVTVDDLSVGGTLAPDTQTICVFTASTPLVLTGNNGSVLFWEYSSDGGGTWGIASGSSTASTLSLVPYASLPGTHVFRAVVQNGVCDPIPSEAAVMFVKPNPLAASLSANPTVVCSDSNFVINANGYLGDIQWQVSTINGTTGFNDIPGEVSPSYGTSITNGTTSNVSQWYRTISSNIPCLSTATSNVIEIIVSPVTQAGTVDGPNDSTCVGGNPGVLTLTGYVGNVTSLFQRINGGVITNIVNTNDIYSPGTLNTAGIYEFAAVVKSGACDADTTAFDTIHVLPAVVVNVSGPNDACEGVNITLNSTVSGGTGSYSYQWQRDGLNVGGDSSLLVTDNTLIPGTYNYTLIVSSGQCTQTSSVHQVTVRARPVITNVTTANLQCYGVNTGSINISAVADSFSIDSGATFVSGNTFNGLSAGSYYVVARNTFSCNTYHSGNPIVLTQPDSTEISFTIVEPNCATSGDGQITVAASGGTPGYEYALDGGSYQGSNVFSNLAPGTFTISVRDNNNCVYSKDTTLSAQYSFSLNVDSVKNVSCPGSADAYVQLGTTGGVAPFTFSMDNSLFQADSVFTGLVAGNYTFYSRDVNGCLALVNVNIVESPPVHIELDSVVEITCNGETDAEIYVSASGSTLPYTFTWRLNGAIVSNAEDLIGIGPGSYNLTVSSSASCEATLAVTITEPNLLTANVVSTNNTSCNGASDGGATVSITGGNPNYTFSWIDGTNAQVSANQNLSGVGPGTYILTVTDINGCMDTTSATISQPGVISVVAVTNNPSCNNSNDGTITVNVNGGTSPYTYSLNNGPTQNSNVFSNLSAGIYTIAVLDANGCDATGNAILNDQYSFSLGVQSQTNVSCAGQNDGTVTLQAMGGVGTITYTVNGVNPQTSNVFTGLSGGFYIFEAVDSNGCAADTSATIFENPPINLSLDSTTNVDCNGQNSGAIYVSSSGGATPYSYSLNGAAGQANGSFTGLTAGSYNIVVTDSIGCSASLNATITEPNTFSATTTGITSTSCNGTTDGGATVSITGGTPSYTFDWVDATNAQVSTNQNLSGVGAGSYTLTVTDANGCTTNTTATVSEPGVISVVAVTNNPSCNNSNDGTITVNVNGGTPPYSYSMNNGPSQNTNVYSNLSAGTYTIAVLDANGCSATGNAILNNQYNFTLEVQSQINVTCSGQKDGSVTLLASNGIGTITYTIDGLNPQTSNVFSGLSGGSYLFEAIDSNGCSDTTTATIVENPPLSVELDSLTNIACNGEATGAIYVSATGGATPYSYSLNGATGQPNGNFTGLIAGTYTVSVTDDAGCTVSLNAEVTQPSPIFLVIASYQDLLCFGQDDGRIDVSVAGGSPPFTYSWSDGTSVVGSSEDAEDLAVGNYTLTVTDDNGCTSMISQAITSPPALAGMISTTNELCFGDNNGTAAAVVSGGTSPYTYLWSTFENDSAISGLSGGVISVLITDVNGCELTLTDTVSGPTAELEIDLIRINNVTCFGGNDGEILTTVSGGTAPYTITWLPGGMNTEIVSNLTAGPCTMNVVDASGCVTSDVFVVTQPPQIVSTMSITNPACFGQETGMALVGASGGTPPFVYNWNTTPSQSGALANNLAGDTSYIVTITDFNACVVTDTAELVYPAGMIISTTEQGVTCIANDNGQVAVQVQGGNAPYVYQLNGFMQNDSVFDNLAEGSYVVFVMDNNNCNASAQFDIVENAVLEIDLQGAGNDNVYWSDDLMIIRGEQVDLLVDILSSGIPVDAISWSSTGSISVDTSACINPPCFDAIIQPLEDITVIVNVLDTNGCVVQDTLAINVAQDPEFFMPTAFSPNGDCLNDNFEINILGGSNMDVRVYNRWGEEVFHNANQVNGLSTQAEMEAECLSGNLNPRNAWDGTFKGEPVPNGVFTYQINVSMFDGTTKTMNGTVTVLR